MLWATDRPDTSSTGACNLSMDINWLIRKNVFKVVLKLHENLSLKIKSTSEGRETGFVQLDRKFSGDFLPVFLNFIRHKKHFKITVYKMNLHHSIANVWIYTGAFSSFRRWKYQYICLQNIYIHIYTRIYMHTYILDARAHRHTHTHSALVTMMKQQFSQISVNTFAKNWHFRLKCDCLEWAWLSNWYRVSHSIQY